MKSQQYPFKECNALAFRSLFACADFTYLWPAYLVFSSQFRIGHIRSKNIEYVGFCEPAVPVAFSGRAAPFQHAVCLVVSVSAGRQVGRVDAGWSVARVQENHPFWNRTNEVFIRKPMRSDILAVDAKAPIAELVNPSIPNPARLCFGEAAKKSLNWCWKRMFIQTAGLTLAHVTRAAQKAPNYLRGATKFARHVESFVVKPQLCHNHSTV